MSEELSRSIVSLLKNATSELFEITCNETIHDFKYDIVKRTIEASQTHVIDHEEQAGAHIRLWIRRADKQA